MTPPAVKWTHAAVAVGCWTILTVGGLLYGESFWPWVPAIILAALVAAWRLIAAMVATSRRINAERTRHEPTGRRTGRLR